MTAVLLALTLLFAAGGVQTCRATTEANLNYVTYDDNNKADVTTESVDVSFDAARWTKVLISGTLDSITGASRKIPIINGITAATSTNQLERVEQRKEKSLGVAQRVGLNTFTVIGDNSLEDDYESNSYNLTWAKEFNKRNNAVTLTYSSFKDKLFPFGVSWTDTKDSQIYDLSFTSVLTTRSQMRATASYGLDDGYLSNPYHRINIDGFYFMERHPVLRDKLAFGLFYNLGFAGDRISSIQLDYRYYTDSWEVKSNTFGVKFSQHITDALTASLRQRYYAQSGAFFFKNPYTQEEEFMTGDPKLAPLTSTLSGIGLTLEATRWLSFELLYEQYHQRSSINYAYIYESVAKADLISQILFISTKLKFNTTSE